MLPVLVQVCAENMIPRRRHGAERRKNSGKIGPEMAHIPPRRVFRTFSPEQKFYFSVRNARRVEVRTTLELDRESFERSRGAGASQLTSSAREGN